MGKFLNLIQELKAEQQPIKILLFGRPGIGKSTLAATADADPNMSRAIYINIEHGMLSLTDPKQYGGEKALQYVTITEFKQFVELVDELTTENHEFKTVIIDTVSVLAKLYLIDAVNEWNVKFPNRSREDFEIQLADYQSVNMKFIRLIDKLRNSGMHIICIAHERTDKDTKEVIPDVQGAVLSTLHGAMDVLAYYRFAPQEVVDAAKKANLPLDSDGELRQLVFKMPGVFAKDRTPGSKLGKSMLSPTMTKIFKKINDK